MRLLCVIGLLLGWVAVQALAQSASDHEGAQWEAVDARLRELFEQLMKETGSTNAADPTVEQMVTLFRGLVCTSRFRHCLGRGPSADANQCIRDGRGSFIHYRQRLEYG